MTTPKATLAALRKHALTYPEATEEFLWGDRTIKVRGKIFVFLGAGKDGFGMSAKLPATHELALTRKGTRPSPYGLGKAGWVSLQTKTVKNHVSNILAKLGVANRAAAAAALRGSEDPSGRGWR